MFNYLIKNIDKVDSPSLVLYKENLEHNLNTMLSMVNGDASIIMPHVKTNKMPEVIKRMIALGIINFKASTIAEATMAIKVGAYSILLAHQLVGPKVARYIELHKKYPGIQLSTLIDNIESADLLNKICEDENIIADVYVDINNGMNRTGIEMGKALDDLVGRITDNKNLALIGLHVYDGHIRDAKFTARKARVEDGLEQVYQYYNALKEDNSGLKLICGGTPTFTSHLNEKDRIVSPGTCVFWDYNYSKMLSEQNFKYAVLIITRVISKPTNGIVTIDMGHKSIAAENSIDKRVKFLNLKNYELLSQSEEHGVLRVQDWDTVNIGDVFYGVPFHICPTVNLHNYATVISENVIDAKWHIDRAR